VIVSVEDKPFFELQNLSFSEPPAACDLLHPEYKKTVPDAALAETQYSGFSVADERGCLVRPESRCPGFVRSCPRDSSELSPGTANGPIRSPIPTTTTSTVATGMCLVILSCSANASLATRRLMAKSVTDCLRTACGAPESTVRRWNCTSLGAYPWWWRRYERRNPTMSTVGTPGLVFLFPVVPWST
jgi:hypothetical protein